MKTPSIFMIVVALGLGFLSGCTGGEKAAPGVAVELKNSGHLDVYSVNLEQCGDTAVVSGLIRQTGVSPSAAHSHVDVEVVKPDGQVIYQTRSETISVPRHIIGKGMKHKSFHIPLKLAQDHIDPADQIILKACTNKQCSIKPI